MKKLALALVCLVSVAFFASCTKPVDNPEPSIAVMTGENYVYDGQTIDLNSEYNFGIRVASNSQTMKELATFTLSGKIFGMDDVEVYAEDTTFAISGTEYVYQEVLSYTMGSKELVGKVAITATVADVDGKTNSVTVNLTVNQPALELVVEDINWVKTGHNAQDLSEYGLFWKETNYKSPFTHITPADGCTLYLVEDAEQVFASIVTDFDLANKYAELTETSRPINDYGKIDCNASANYTDLLITKDADDILHAIYITRAEITTPSGLGTRITITGKAK